tara:strand:+ start:10766 stop:12109 length:1344 start_codon:yes stop_codon:yes gene_type:complete
MNKRRHDNQASLNQSTVFHDWWPLAASWGLMGLEMPCISVVVGNLPNPETMLAAFGGIAFPLGLLVEAPIIMMLAASTALSRDSDSFRRLQRFMTCLAVLLTVLHALLAFTPLWEWVVVPALDIPDMVQSPARESFAWLLPWTWAIADRRFRQGLLIQFGMKQVIVFGTGIRLIATIGTLLILAANEVPGATLASASLSVGVIVEAVYVRFRSRSVVDGPLRSSPPAERPLVLRRLLKFYIPLALTPILILAAQPIGAAGMTRMPNPLESLAVWAPLGGLIFLLRSSGIAYNEVCIRLGDLKDSYLQLKRFAWITGGLFAALLALLAASPLAHFWLEQVVGLDAELASLGTRAIWLAVPIPLLTFLQSLYQGLLVNAHQTRPITEAVCCYLGITVAGMVAGVVFGSVTGLYVALLTYTAANLAQTVWLYIRSKHLMRPPPQINEREH